MLAYQIKNTFPEAVSMDDRVFKAACWLREVASLDEHEILEALEQEPVFAEMKPAKLAEKARRACEFDKGMHIQAHVDHQALSPLEQWCVRRNYDFDAVKALNVTGHVSLKFNGKNRERVVCFSTWNSEGETISRKLRCADNGYFTFGTEKRKTLCEKDKPAGLIMTWPLPNDVPIHLVESECDAAALVSAGAKAVIATPSAGGSAPSWEDLQTFVVDRDVILVPQRGRPATAWKRLAGQMCSEAGAKSIHFIPPNPKFSDIDELLRRHQPTRKKELLSRLTSKAPEWRDQEIGEDGEEYPFSKEELLSFAEQGDVGNARAFSRLYHGEVVFDEGKSSWRVYNNGIWEIDPSEVKLTRMATDLSHFFHHQPYDLEDEEFELWKKHKLYSQKGSAIREMTKLAKGQDGMALKSSEFDKNQFLLNCPNGTYDLRKGDFCDHDPLDYLTQNTNTVFDEHATCSKFDHFLSQVFNGCVETSRYFQKVIGYCVTGSDVEQLYWLLDGPGGTGKTTTCEIALQVMGTYAAPSPRGFLAPNKMGRSSGPSMEMEMLRGLRMLAIDENPRNIDEDMLKLITGGGTQQSRAHHGKFEQFKGTHKCLVVCNTKPRLSQSEAVWRRTVVIPFKQSFVGKANPNLKDELLAESSGILNWMIQGFALYQSEGLKSPAPIQQAIDDYRKEEDVLGQFIEDKCVLEATSRIGATEMYRVYKAWAQDQGFSPKNQTNFGIELSERGIERKKVSTQHYLGIRLKYEHEKAGENDTNWDSREAWDGFSNVLVPVKGESSNEPNPSCDEAIPKKPSHASHNTEKCNVIDCEY